MLKLKEVLLDAGFLTFIIPTVTVFPQEKKGDFRMFIVKSVLDKRGHETTRYRYFPEQNRVGLDFYDADFARDGLPPEFNGLSLDEMGWRIDPEDLKLAASYVVQLNEIINRHRSENNDSEKTA